jgi:hypothetical protein
MEDDQPDAVFYHPDILLQSSHVPSTSVSSRGSMPHSKASKKTAYSTRTAALQMMKGSALKMKMSNLRAFPTIVEGEVVDPNLPTASTAIVTTTRRYPNILERLCLNISQIQAREAMTFTLTTRHPIRR